MPTDDGLYGAPGRALDNAPTALSERLSPPTYDAGANADTTDTADNAITVTDAAGVARVKLGLLASGDYGLTVTNGSSVVIIDGTSNMFKIQATGTLSKAQLATSTGSTTTTLSALGALSTTPAHLSFVSTANTTAAEQVVGAVSTLQPPTSSFIATASGGAVTFNAGGVLTEAWMTTSLDGSSQCVVTLNVRNYDVAGVTRYGRYYVLAEAAL